MSELTSIDHTKDVVVKLMSTPHFKKLGEEGIYALVQTSRALGLDINQALQGGLYYVKGKVEMSARMMNSMIRAKKHSIQRDPSSNDQICILHGRRADNGDVWTESFSIEEAQRAGLLSNPVWKTYTRDMLFARALSRLARQLFPDVIGNCYVEGEIAGGVEAVALEEEVMEVKAPDVESEALVELAGRLQRFPDLCERIKRGLGSMKFEEMPLKYYEKAKALVEEAEMAAEVIDAAGE